MKVGVEFAEDVTIIKPEGKLDALTAADFQESIDRTLNDGHDQIVVDMIGTVYVSSAGLRVFIRMAKRLLPNHQLVVANLTPAVRQIFDLAGFPILMTICDNLDDAIEVVNNRKTDSEAV